MLQFLVVFFGVFTSIISVNDFNKQSARYDDLKDQETAFYIESLFAQQYYLYSFCSSKQCNKQNYSDQKQYLPPEFIMSDWSSHVFTCYGKHSGFVTLVTGINSGFFDDAFIHQARAFMSSHSGNIQFIKLITNSNEFPDVDDCTNRNGRRSEKVLLLSTTYAE